VGEERGTDGRDETPIEQLDRNRGLGQCDIPCTLQLARFAMPEPW
jgi:hypothetical protein